MSIRYFSKWLQDEEKSFADWRNPWAWLDLNVTDPPPGVIYLHQKPLVLTGDGQEAPPSPFLVGQGDNFELSPAEVVVDGGSTSFIIRRSTLYIFKFSPIVILVLGIITNTIQLALCCRLRHKLPAVAFIATIAAADLVSVLLGAGRLSVDRLFSISLDHFHPWSCKMRHFLLASALDLSAWLVPLGLCELWRPAGRLIVYATIMSLLLNLQNLVTRGWQVQGDFGLEPIMNDCGYSFPDARIFWLHVHPIVSVIINVIGPTITAMLLIMTLSFQGRCHPNGSKKVDVKRGHNNKKPHRMLRINLLCLFAVLAIVQAILLAPTAVLSAMELFLNMTVNPSMRALVLFAQLINCVIKLPLIFLAAPQLCPAMNESKMNFYGEKHPKKVKNKQQQKQQAMSPSQDGESDLGDQSGYEDAELEDHNSLMRQNYYTTSSSSNNGHHQPIYHQNDNGEVKKQQKKKSASKNKQQKYEEVITIDPPTQPLPLPNEIPPIDAGKQLAQATNSTMSRNNSRPPPPPPQSLSLISTDHFYQTNTHHRHHHHHHLPQPLYQGPTASTAAIIGSGNQQSLFPATNNSIGNRHTSLVTTNNSNNNINGSLSLTAAAVNALQAGSGSTLPLPPPPHFQQQTQQLYWLNDGVGKMGTGETSGGRKIYV